MYFKIITNKHYLKRAWKSAKIIFIINRESYFLNWTTKEWAVLSQKYYVDLSIYLLRKREQNIIFFL